MKKGFAVMLSAIAIALAVSSCQPYDARHSHDIEYFEENDIYVPWWIKEDAE